MEYLREGLTHILDRLKVKSDPLATARMQVSTVRQATNDVILLTVRQSFPSVILGCGWAEPAVCPPAKLLKRSMMLTARRLQTTCHQTTPC